MDDWMHYSPYWLHSLQGHDRDEVVHWLQDHDIDPDICASFEVSMSSHMKPLVVRCKMYRTQMTTMGLRPVVDEHADFLWDEDLVFTPRWTPRALRITKHVVPSKEST